MNTVATEQNRGPKLHIPTEEENQAALREFFAERKQVNEERRQAVLAAEPALKRLCEVMCDRSGQCYKVRSILYSLWNGQPTQISETLNLDWQIKKDICAVILAFGFEDKDTKFFYNALEQAVRATGQWDWFLLERFEYKVMEEYVRACRRAE